MTDSKGKKESELFILRAHGKKRTGLFPDMVKLLKNGNEKYILFEGIKYTFKQ